MKKTWSLTEFYKEVEKEDYKENFFIKIPDSKNTSFQIIKILGKGHSGFVFLSRDSDGQLVALRLSYDNVDFLEILKTVRWELGEDYSTYLLGIFNLEKRSISGFKIKNIPNQESVVFNKKVYISAWINALGLG